ncbi:exodeoxyribonuclease VII large subunit [Oligoflexia bacterium]|nr:exodeoxyribonuclease VII large subunit [Oligoflexia bacterium]
MSTSRYITISALVRLLNKTLEEHLSPVSFEGEISECKRAASGHIYFTVKDDESQISAVMWRGVAQGLGFDPEVGISVLCQGKPNVYSKGGRLQIVVHKMAQAGEGVLQKKFLELKEKLSKEGLFAEERKRQIPFFPTAVGIVTSRSGAVIHDMMTKMRERMPNIKVFLVDVRVQGDGAAEEIAKGINVFSKAGVVDVVIVARGGGSLEDLWAFNEEVVAQAIFASRIPIVSGVGHEVDVTLSDLVADLRAPTPTAAAEAVVPKRDDLLETIKQLEERLFDLDAWFQPIVQAFDELAQRLEEQVSWVVEQSRLLLDTARAKLAAIQPGNVVAMFSARVGTLKERLLSCGLQNMAALHKRVDFLGTSLNKALPPQKLAAFQAEVNYLEDKLGSCMLETLRSQAHALERCAGRLEAVSPQKVLERGFSIVESGEKIVRSYTEVEVGDELAISFARGSVAARVTQKSRANK